MLEAKYFRQDLNLLVASLAKRGITLDTTRLSTLELARKQCQMETELWQSQRNQLAKQVGQAKARSEDVSELLHQSEQFACQLKAAEVTLTELLSELHAVQAALPNIPDDSVPLGRDEHDNVEVRTWGTIPTFGFAPRDHVDLGVSRGLIDFESAVKLASARFVVLYGPMARLQRALTQFMVDLHSQQHGYTEVYVPNLVNGDSLYGTGQLPNMEEDLFKTTVEPALYLIPTAEVPVTNLARDRIFEATQLPVKYVCHTPCFRSEAGSYGKDTRGMLRQHQFEKVELVQFVKPEDSVAAHEALTSHAEAVLQALKLPYRVMLLCAGDMGFSASKTYDLEVWLPGQQCYREISSCSMMKDFQARRLKARWRNPLTGKVELIHTLNGSGLAVGRTLLAVIENYQTAEGQIRIPEVLLPYMNGISII